jgi:hypothetical protein
VVRINAIVAPWLASPENPVNLKPFLVLIGKNTLQKSSLKVPADKK